MKEKKDMYHSIVQINKTGSVVKDSTSPWALTLTKSTATGFIIKLNDEIIIVTNAHCVANATYITVQFPNGTKEYEAKTFSINHPCDLALLKCQAPQFLAEASPLTLADEIPHENEKIFVHGFPRGNQYAVTKGQISRIDTMPYMYSGGTFLNLTLDVTLQPGNSGGPAMYANKVVGVAHQCENAAKSQGTAGFANAIPVLILKQVLKHPKGLPELSFLYQGMRNPAMRKRYGLVDGEFGIVVRDVYLRSCEYNVLMPGDVILEVDGNPIKADGNIKSSVSENPIHFTHLIDMCAFGDTINIKIMRNKKEQIVPLILSTPRDKVNLINFAYDENVFRYFAAHGLVFVPLTRNYLAHAQNTLPANTAKLVNLQRYCKHKKTADESKKFVISKVLPGDHAEGFRGYEDSVVVTIDGKKIKNMCQLIETLNKSPDCNEYNIHEIVTDGNSIITVPHLTPQENLNLLKRSRISAQAPESVIEKYKAHKERKERAIAEEINNKQQAQGDGKSSLEGNPSLFFYNREETNDNSLLSSVVREPDKNNYSSLI